MLFVQYSKLGTDILHTLINKNKMFSMLCGRIIKSAYLHNSGMSDLSRLLPFALSLSLSAHNLEHTKQSPSAVQRQLSAEMTNNPVKYLHRVDDELFVHERTVPSCN